MKTRLLLSVCMLVSLGGCDMVYSVQPVGSSPVNLTGAESEWEGQWYGISGGLMFKIKDAKKGELQVFFLDAEGDEPSITKFDMYLRSHQGWTFASLKQVDTEPDNEHYLWFRIDKRDNQLICWTPDIDKTRELMKEGILPVHTDTPANTNSDALASVPDDGDIVLGEMDETTLDIITTSSHGVLLLWEHPVVLFRLFNS